jgi:hypothetical protein
MEHEGLTSDRNDERLKKHRKDGQQEVYLVLSEEERAQEFVRPLRKSYRHILCGSVTTMNVHIAETYARNPHFYTGTFCVSCKEHFSLVDSAGLSSFVWIEDGMPVGS